MPINLWKYLKLTTIGFAFNPSEINLFFEINNSRLLDNNVIVRQLSRYYLIVEKPDLILIAVGLSLPTWC